MRRVFRRIHAGHEDAAQRDDANQYDYPLYPRHIVEKCRSVQQHSGSACLALQAAESTAGWRLEAHRKNVPAHRLPPSWGWSSKESQKGAEIQTRRGIGLSVLVGRG